jgi:thiamine pyrophosphate-dependent acetolactate synthase large subunit-like protein
MIAPHNDRGVMHMDPVVVALARAAGLDKALAAFPDDVKAAAEQAMSNASVVKFPTDPAAEPWPPMRAGTGL